MENAASATNSAVMRGLDPRIHDERPHAKALLPLSGGSLMDCRVKPGNDRGEAVPVLLRQNAGAS
jgi:hypothetical protein